MSADPFSPFDPVDGMPVTIVFGTFNYRSIIHEWIRHALSSCKHWRIVCMDQELVGWLDEIGHGACAIYLYDLFPDKPHRNLVELERSERAPIIFAMRKKLWLALAESGRDFINSDADAFWLQDPLPWLGQHSEFDILISQGEFAPRTHLARYHFTINPAFFLCRANVRTQNFLRQVEAIKDRMDLQSMNDVILHDPETCWQVPRKVTWSWGMREVPALTRVVLELAQRLAPLWLRRLKTSKINPDCPGRLDWLRVLLEYIYISSDIIRGRFSNRLTIGVIPMHLVLRFKYMSSAPPLVSHLYGNRQGIV